MRLRIDIFVLVTALLTASPAIAQVAGSAKRAALVIGNAAYAVSPLANPVNDAADMAALLKSADMEVISRTNLDLAGMEQAADDFIKLLKGKESAVVYYSGHGMQVGDENYLIPVKENIRNETQVRSRSLAVGDLMERIKDSGVSTIVLFLDACRDNPFPGSSRGGARGLRVVAIPKEVETLVAYATEPGATADDGDNRNGVFTEALLKNLAVPGVNITEVMLKVRSDVLAASGGKQSPRVDLGLSRPWYLLDPDAVARRADEASKKAFEELAAIEREISDWKSKIKASKDKAAKQELELEQKKAEAARAAKRLEAENLEKTAALKREAAAAEEKKQSEVAASIKAQDVLAAAMAVRRAELEKIGEKGADNDPDALVADVARLRDALTEIEGQFGQSKADAERGIKASFATLYASLAKAKPELWESDAEFASRVKADRAKLEADEKATLANRSAVIDEESSKQTAGLKTRYEKALAKLSAKTWILTGSQVGLTIGEYDRNKRLWPLNVKSLDPSIKADEELVIDFNKSKDFKAELSEFDLGIKAGSLVGEIGWGIELEAAKNRYLIILKSAGVRNLNTSKVVASRVIGKPLASFTPGKRENAVSLYATVDFGVAAGFSDATVFVNDKKIGKTPLSSEVIAGDVRVRYVWDDDYRSESAQSWAEGASYTLRLERDLPIRDEVFVRGGDFRTGGNSGRTRSGTEVRLSDFWMMKTEVTQRDLSPLGWLGGYYSEIRGNAQVEFHFAGKELPVDSVNWYYAVYYANKLSKKDKLKPAYKIKGDTVTCDWSADGWRLPTEAEWEYAAGGGARSDGNKYAGGADIDAVAWYSQNSERTTHPVGTKAPNELGLYDMSGNVAEWCWDFSSKNYPSDTEDPRGPAEGDARSIRGGDWEDNAISLTVTHRRWDSPSNKPYDVGFRLVRRAR